MGREIRRVPPNWEHPRQECKHSPWAGGCADALAHEGCCYKPLFGPDYAVKAREWLDHAMRWDRNEFLSHENADDKSEHPFYWEWNGMPPDKDDYVSYRPEEATWFQVYETASEGTPVTPPFAAKEELVAHLVKYGDDWGHGNDKWSEMAAREFVEYYEWTPTLIIADGKLYRPQDGIPSAVE